MYVIILRITRSSVIVKLVLKCTFKITQVDVEDWFDSSNLADHTSMILQAMMYDVFDTPEKPSDDRYAI